MSADIVKQQAFWPGRARQEKEELSQSQILGGLLSEENPSVLTRYAEREGHMKSRLLCYLRLQMYIYFSAQQITGFIQGRRRRSAWGASSSPLLFLYHCGEQQTAQITGCLSTTLVHICLLQGKIVEE